MCIIEGPAKSTCLLKQIQQQKQLKRIFNSICTKIKLVLDRIFKAIEGQNDAEKYSKISNRYDDLYKFYKKATLSGDKTLDYSDSVTMFSYIYRNTAFHAK